MFFKQSSKFLSMTHIPNPCPTLGTYLRCSSSVPNLQGKAIVRNLSGSFVIRTQCLEHDNYLTLFRRFLCLVNHSSEKNTFQLCGFSVFYFHVVDSRLLVHFTRYMGWMSASDQRKINITSFDNL